MPPACRACGDALTVLRKEDTWVCERHGEVTEEEIRSGSVWMARGSLAKKWHTRPDCPALLSGFAWTGHFGGGDPRPLMQTTRAEARRAGREPCQRCAHGRG